MSYRSLFYLLSLLFAVCPPAVAEEEFCLSGGFRNGYSCEVPLFTELDSRNTSFSVQLLEQGDQRLLSELEQVVHISELEGNKRLVYLGRYETQASGMAAMQKTLKQYGPEYHPMLVALTPSAQMPRIRLVAEPNISVALADVSENSATARNERTSASVGASRVYAIQLGAFSGVKDAKQFSDQLAAPDLICRQKNNGLYAVYYRRFDSLGEAQTHMNDHAFIDELGGYVVALNNVQFSPCSDLKGPESQTNTLLAERINTPESGPVVDPTESVAEPLVHTSTQALEQETEVRPKVDSLGLNGSSEAFELVYSLQVAAFKQSSTAKRFVARHSDLPLLCRKKDNGLSAVYYGTYRSFSEARAHMSDHPMLVRQKGYAVKLSNVTFEICR
ncbi:MAG: SPOR domain-containing protein [Cellvibrionaceae bacterium]